MPLDPTALEHSAQLLSAADQLRAQLRTVRPALDRALYDLVRVRLVASLAPGALEAAWQAGAAAPLATLIEQLLVPSS